MKVVINTCFGGFGLSEKAWKRYSEFAGFKLIKHPGKFGDELYKDSVQEDNFLFEGDLSRTDPILVQVVEELGADANDRFSDLKIVQIPDNIEWYIHEYDGKESIHEQHRSWS